MDLSREAFYCAIDQLGFPRTDICLEGGLPNEAYCLEILGNRWSTYYSERGRRSNLRIFDSESDALQDILNECIRSYRWR